MEGNTNIMLFLTRLVFCILFVMLTGVAVAQDELEEVEVGSDPLEAARAKGGDILIMKSGAIMSGVQILRSSPKYYYVHVIDGVKPLEISRRAVVSVEYDDIDLVKQQRREDMFPDVAKEIGRDGEELSPALLRKLRNPITEDVMTFENKDYLEILNDFIEKNEIPLVIHDSVKNMKPENRIWTVELDENLKLVHFLQKFLLRDFPKLHCKYELDSIQLMTQRALENEKTEKDKPPTAFKL
jgi:hypothetical protein